MKNKSVTNKAHFCLLLWNVGLFAFIWIFYYNDFAFRANRAMGAAISILIYFILYNAL